jgi:hypothetical protein
MVNGNQTAIANPNIEAGSQLLRPKINGLDSGMVFPPTITPTTPLP